MIKLFLIHENVLIKIGYFMIIVRWIFQEIIDEVFMIFFNKCLVKFNSNGLLVYTFN
jgi:hypothetical protein